MAYYSNYNNWYIACNRHEFLIINQFLDTFIPLIIKKKCIKIQPLFYCFKQCQYMFIVTGFFYSSTKNLALFGIEFT